MNDKRQIESILKNRTTLFLLFSGFLLVCVVIIFSLESFGNQFILNDIVFILGLILLLVATLLPAVWKIIGAVKVNENRDSSLNLKVISVLVFFLFMGSILCLALSAVGSGDWINGFGFGFSTFVLACVVLTGLDKYLKSGMHL